MNRKLTELSRRYQSALEKHLKEGPPASLHLARGLGRQAVVLGLETLEVTRIHEDALAALAASTRGNGAIRRAETFFNEVITPIEKTHRAARKATVRLTRLSQTLGRRMVSLAVANRLLKQGVVERKAVEKALQKSGGHNSKLLKKSHHLEGHLRLLTHQILSAQEDKRKMISRELHDEIAQTLLGINIRLLTLKNEAASNVDCLKTEIASTQRLVQKSVKTLNRFAREFSIHHES